MWFVHFGAGKVDGGDFLLHCLRSVMVFGLPKIRSHLHLHCAWEIMGRSPTVGRCSGSCLWCSFVRCRERCWEAVQAWMPFTCFRDLTLSTEKLLNQQRGEGTHVFPVEHRIKLHRTLL